tara:strand:+ start:23 stop:331 length:309 start_codon:yes stop_codon:yes gene_type:complete
MFTLFKVQIAIGIIIFTLLTWATQNVCRYNFVLEKKKTQMNIISEEVEPTLGLTQIYYYKELNCNKVNFSLDVNRMMNNFRTISVMVYQYLSTDITGRPINE